MVPEVRAARPEDRFAVLRMCRDFHAASRIPFAFDPAHASMTAADYIADPRKLCLVLECAGRLGGVLAAVKSTSPLAPVLISQELVFWIDPPFRGRSAFAMIAAYEDWARSEGCAAAGLAGLDDPRIARLFGAAGFAPMENQFLKLLG